MAKRKSKRREKRIAKPTAYLRRRLPALPSMSDTLLDFAAPLLAGLDSMDRVEEFEPFLALSVLLWNFSFAEEDIRAEEGEVAAGLMRAEVLDTLQEILQFSREECEQLVERMSQRKRDLFPDEWRSIISFQARDTPDGVHVLVASRV